MMLSLNTCKFVARKKTLHKTAQNILADKNVSYPVE